MGRRASAADQSLEIPKRPPDPDLTWRDAHWPAAAILPAPLALKEMPSNVPRAFVAIEDRRFYEHYGVDPFGIARAAMANILHRGVAQGGSTITQQLAKNLFLTQERTITRKLQEAMLALWLERKFSKTQILELDLNRVYFGSGAYGIEQAALRYFGKSARHITLADAALLAGLVKSPARLAPTPNFDGAERRAQVVPAAMAEPGFISDAHAHVAMTAAAHRRAGRQRRVHHVADWIMDALNDVLGHVEEDIVVRTTIVPACRRRGKRVEAGGEGRQERRCARRAGRHDDGRRGARSGQRHNYADSQFNRAVAAKRQPGSAFKPFVYLTALEHGLTPDTVRVDGPVKIKGWQPENYSHEYFGPVTLTTALAMSLNTVSVRLTMEVSPMAVIRTAHRLGIASKLEPNASIALGTSEVSPLELVGAFATFANGGFAVVPHVIQAHRRRARQAAPMHAATSSSAASSKRAMSNMMNTMMQETLTIGTARKATLPGWPGGRQDRYQHRISATPGSSATPRLVTGVWLGNDDGAPTKKVTGGGMPVDIWSRFMREAHQGVPVAALPGASGGGLFSGLFGGHVPAPQRSSVGMAPVPPAAIGVSAGNAPQARGGGIDGWLIDKLFGR